MSGTYLVDGTVSEDMIEHMVAHVFEPLLLVDQEYLVLLMVGTHGPFMSHNG